MSKHDEVMTALDSVPTDDGVIVVEWLGWEKGSRKLAERAPAKADPAKPAPAACMIVFGGPARPALLPGTIPPDAVLAYPTRPPETNSAPASGAPRDGGW